VASLSSAELGLPNPADKLTSRFEGTAYVVSSEAGACDNDLFRGNEFFPKSVAQEDLVQKFSVALTDGRTLSRIEG
jgi:hypothetical protein